MDKFVSRGGVKLQAALDQFKVDVKDKIVLDVGSSTGGFVECLLQNGAGKVYSVDTSYGELAWKLRNDPRVIVMERTNILHLAHLPGVKAHLEGGRQDTSDGGRLVLSEVEGMDSSGVEKAEGPERSRRVDLITIDAGWTKLELVLPVVKKFLKQDGIIIALLKPHYEAQKKDLVKGVLPSESAEQIKDQVIERVKDLGFRVEEVIDSPILGGAGNREYLLKVIAD